MTRRVRNLIKAIDEWRNNDSVGSNTPNPEHESRQIQSDRGRSSPAERVYPSDTVEPHSGIRVRWADSDPYSYKGNCRKLN